MSIERTDEGSCDAAAVPEGGERVTALARVVAVSSGRVTVETQRMNACTSCGASTQCGSAALNRLIGPPDTKMTLASGLEVVPGQAVVLSVPEGGLVLAAALAYLLPLAGLLGAVVLAALTGAGEAGLILAAVFGLGAGLWSSHWLTRRPGLLARLLPVRLETK